MRLLRTSPTWAGIALVVIGLAVLVESVAVASSSSSMFLIADGAILVARRRRARSGQPEEPDPQVLRRMARDSDASSVLFAFAAVECSPNVGISTAAPCLHRDGLLMGLVALNRDGPG